jgi:hypothetical protein
MAKISASTVHIRALSTDSGLKNKVRQIRVVFKGTMQRDFLIQVLPADNELNQSEEDQGGL